MDHVVCILWERECEGEVGEVMVLIGLILLQVQMGLCFLVVARSLERLENRLAESEGGGG